MSEKSREIRVGNEMEFSRQMKVKATRKMKARRQVPKGTWFGFSMFGIVGWSVAIPTLLGVAGGTWLDRKYPGPHSRTLALLVAGLIVGCWMAWHWVSKEYKDIQDEEEPKHE